MVNTLDEWYAQAERGTRGDMVYSILKDWKEREQELDELKNEYQELLALIDTLNLEFVEQPHMTAYYCLGKINDHITQAVTIANNDSKEDNNET